MHLEVEEKEGFNIVSVVGELDVYTVPLFRKVLLKIEGDRKHDIVLDLSKMTFIDSSGIGSLIETYQKVTSSEGSIVFVVENPRILKILKMVNLDSVFNIFSNLGKAFQFVGVSSGYIDEDFFSDKIERR
ncbi:MAG: STAS domain-containing protein [Actinomycetota bacterium]|nr:STAS domain-containing protein [Actinomycetota bacterium]